MTIRAVLLDAGGVLVLPQPDSLLPVLEEAGVTGITPADLARAHYAGIAAMDRSHATKGVTADWPAYHRAYVDALGVSEALRPAALEAVATAFATLPWTGEIPGVVDALRRLADTGVALAIVSNSNGTVEQLLLDARVCQVGPGEGVPVAVVVDSTVLGVEKPHPEIFHHALGALGVPAGAAVHVGDTGWADIEGAQAAGVRPLHVDPHGDCPHPDGHEHVAGLDDVVALVIAGG